LASSKIESLRSFRSKKGRKIAIFQILKTVQGQNQDLKKMVLRLRPDLRTTSLD